MRSWWQPINGEKYLREQIESIQTQTYAEWTCYIQDDGSTDNTRMIVMELAAADSRIIPVNQGLSRQGCCNNFMTLLNVVESRYYMFCDQDDVWLPDKLQISLTKMNKLEMEYPDTPILLHSDRSIVDQELKMKRQSEWNPHHHSSKVIEKKIALLEDPNILAIYNICAGNTMCFNHAAKMTAFPYVNIRVHDSILAMSVSCGGIIRAIHQPTLLYRIHTAQTCGIHSDGLLTKLFHGWTSFAGNMRGYYIWKIYDKGSFFRFLYYRIKYFLILRFL